MCVCVPGGRHLCRVWRPGLAPPRRVVAQAQRARPATPRLREPEPGWHRVGEQPAPPDAASCGRLEAGLPRPTLPPHQLQPLRLQLITARRPQATGALAPCLDKSAEVTSRSSRHGRVLAVLRTSPSAPRAARARQQLCADASAGDVVLQIPPTAPPARSLSRALPSGLLRASPLFSRPWSAGSGRAGWPGRMGGAGACKFGARAHSCACYCRQLSPSWCPPHRPRRRPP